MSYASEAPPNVQAETRAVLCRGYHVSPSSKPVAAALFAWTKEHDGASGDLSLQLIVHGEDLAVSEWEERPFLVGIFVREVFGKDDDHRTGLTDAELQQRVADADARLDALHASLLAVCERAGATLSDRQLFFTWGGPLPGAKLVKGVARETAEPNEYYWSAEDGAAAFYFCRQGASQDEAPGGAFGFLLASGTYDNGDGPIVVTPELLSAADEQLADAGMSDARLFVFSHYD